MKIRSVLELQDALDEELSWRRQELVNMRLTVASTSEPLQTTLRRAGHALVYAHWEGFVKHGLEYYLTYVRTLAPGLDRLDHCFAGLALKRYLSKQHGLGDHMRLPTVVQMMREGAGSGAHLPENSIIDTRANLNSTVLRELLESLGLDVTVFSTRFNYIDANLLNTRNAIAHGRATAPSQTEFADAVGAVMGLLVETHTLILNSASQKLFLLEPPGQEGQP